MSQVLYETLVNRAFRSSNKADGDDYRRMEVALKSIDAGNSTLSREELEDEFRDRFRKLSLNVRQALDHILEKEDFKGKKKLRDQVNHFKANLLVQRYDKMALDKAISKGLNALNILRGED